VAERDAALRQATPARGQLAGSPRNWTRLRAERGQVRSRIEKLLGPDRFSERRLTEYRPWATSRLSRSPSSPDLRAARAGEERGNSGACRKRRSGSCPPSPQEPQCRLPARRRAGCLHLADRLRTLESELARLHSGWRKSERFRSLLDAPSKGIESLTPARPRGERLRSPVPASSGCRTTPGGHRNASRNTLSFRVPALMRCTCTLNPQQSVL